MDGVGEPANAFVNFSGIQSAVRQAKKPLAAAIWEKRHPIGKVRFRFVAAAQNTAVRTPGSVRKERNLHPVVGLLGM